MWVCVCVCVFVFACAYTYTFIWLLNKYVFFSINSYTWNFWTNLRGSLWPKEHMTHETSFSRLIWHGHFWGSFLVSFFTVFQPRPLMPSIAVRLLTEWTKRSYDSYLLNLLVFWHEWNKKRVVFCVWFCQKPKRLHCWFFFIRGS